MESKSKEFIIYLFLFIIYCRLFAGPSRVGQYRVNCRQFTTNVQKRGRSIGHRQLPSRNGYFDYLQNATLWMLRFARWRKLPPITQRFATTYLLIPPFIHSASLQALEEERVKYSPLLFAELLCRKLEFSFPNHAC